MSPALQPAQKHVAPVEGPTIASAYLFIDQVEMPPELKQNELSNYVELRLEETSPFDIDQMLWGYVGSADGSRLIIYATLAVRLREAGIEAGEEQAWVLPDFIPLLHARFDQPTRVLIGADGDGTECCFDKNRAGPVSVKVCSKKLPKSETIRPTDESTIRLDAPSYRIDAAGHTRFELAAAGGGLLPEALRSGTLRAPEEDALWNADLRAPLFKANECKRRHLSRRLSTIGKGLVIATLVLIPLQVLLILANIWLSHEEATLSQRGPAVQAIMEQQDLTQKLDRIVGNQWADSITVMEAINQYRPVKIHLNSVTIDNSDQVSLEGVSATVDELNLYIGKLVSDASFSLVDAPKTLTRSGETSFIVTLKPKTSISKGVD